MMMSHLMTLTMILVALSYFTLLERKILSYTQIRKGPNKVGTLGILQPISDGLKLFTKSMNLPKKSNKWIFLISPMLGMSLSFLMWTLLPLPYDPSDFNLSLLSFFCISSISSFIPILSGWSSNSLYTTLGAYRAVAQMISYEVSLILIALNMVMMWGNFNLSLSMNNPSWMLTLISWPIMIMWISALLAETNRSPYDFAEAESELVSGFNLEYSSGPFSLLFMIEYMNMIFLSLITIILFSWNPNLLIPLLILLIWTRSTLPRTRYDKLMQMTWKFYLSLSLSMFILFMSFKILTIITLS